MRLSKVKIFTLTLILLGVIGFLSQMVVWESPYKMSGWKTILQEKTVDCDEVVIYEAGDSNPIATAKDKKIIESFFSAIQIDESVIESVMMPARLRFVFEKGGMELISVEQVGSRHLRWPGGLWPSDAKLTALSSEKLEQWVNDVKGRKKSDDEF